MEPSGADAELNGGSHVELSSDAKSDEETYDKRDLFGSDDENDAGTGSDTPSYYVRAGARLSMDRPVSPLKRSEVFNVEAQPFIYTKEPTQVPTVRWRYVEDNGKRSRQSNSRIVQWSDGSYQLLIGKEAFDFKMQAPTSEALSIFKESVADVPNADGTHMWYEEQGGLRQRAVVQPDPTSSIVRAQSLRSKINKLEQQKETKGTGVDGGFDNEIRRRASGPGVHPMASSRGRRTPGQHRMESIIRANELEMDLFGDDSSESSESDV